MAAPVVIVFARHRGELLLCRRDGDLEAPARPRDGAPEEVAMCLVREIFEAGAHATVTRIGDPVTADEVVRHPVLVDVPSRELRSAAVGEPEWRHAPALLDAEVPSGLWSAYREVSPTAEAVIADRSHGSTTLSVRALEVLRDRGAAYRSGWETPTNGWSELAAIARQLATARPEMTVLPTRVDRVVTRAEGSVAGLEARAREELERAARVDERAAENAAERCDGATVLTLSRSGTVRQTLSLANPAAAIVLESRPGREGVAMAEQLATDGIDVTLTPDAAVAHVFEATSVDLLLVGADTVDPDGAVHNKVGTHTAALVAAAADVPVVAVASTDKIAPEPAERTERVDPEELYDGGADVVVDAPRFDRTPAGLIDALVTEKGTLQPSEIAEVATAHRQLRAWRTDRP